MSNNGVGMEMGYPGFFLLAVDMAVQGDVPAAKDSLANGKMLEFLTLALWKYFAVLLTSF